MIEPTDEMLNAYERAAEVAFGLAIVERDWNMQPRPDWPATCAATVETKGTLVRCTKAADDHDAHLGRHCGWDVVW